MARALPFSREAPAEAGAQRAVSRAFSKWQGCLNGSFYFFASRRAFTLTRRVREVGKKTGYLSDLRSWLGNGDFSTNSGAGCSTGELNKLAIAWRQVPADGVRRTGAGTACGGLG